MFKHIIKKIGYAVLTIFIVATLTFFLMKLIPGNPYVNKNMDSQTISLINKKYGLDEPVVSQYIKYMGNLLHGNLGYSISRSGYTVNRIIAEKFPVSLKLGIVVLIFAAIIGIALGCIAAFKQNTLIDRVIVIYSTIFTSIPGFVLAVALLFFFCEYLQIFPTMGLSRPINYVMPVLSAAVAPSAVLIRITRTSLLDVLNQNYINVLKAKGMQKFNILFKHALRNGLLPVITVFGPLTAEILTGNFVVESIFSIQGLGAYIVNSISQRDYPVIMGTTIVYASFLTFANLIVDIVYSIIDPRIELNS
jgi:oligopeptide transport system permease protein